MDKLLDNTFTFIAMIMIGFLFKRAGIFSKDDHKVLMKIVFNITAPAAVILNFTNIKIDWLYFAVIGFGLLCNLAATLPAYVFSHKQSASEKSLFLLMVPGYNINSFAMPYAQSFLGPLGVVSICLFDMGNSVMTLGGNYALTSWTIYGSSKAGMREVAARMLRSIPFLACIVMLVSRCLNQQLPSIALTMASFAGAANGPLAMLVLGAMLELNMDKQNLMLALKALALRYAVSLILGVSIYCLTPFPVEMRQAIVLGLFAPTSALAPMYIEKSSGNTAAAGIAGSISILISMAAISIILLLPKIM